MFQSKDVPEPFTGFVVVQCVEISNACESRCADLMAARQEFINPKESAGWL
jgi:hypothetical protein